MLCNIYVSCKIHGLICAALRTVVFSAGAEGPPPPWPPPPPPRLRPTRGAGWWGSLRWPLAWEFGSAVGLKPHLKMLRNTFLFTCSLEILTGVLGGPVSCAWREAGRNRGRGQVKMVKLRRWGAPGDPRFCSPPPLSFLFFLLPSLAFVFLPVTSDKNLLLCTGHE